MRRLAAAVAAAALLLAGCGQGDDERSDEPGPSPSPSASPTPTATATVTPPATSDAPSGPPRVVEEIATGLQAPWGLGFLPHGDALVTERDTRKVFRITGPDHEVVEVGTIGDAVPQGEAGLLGLAVSPSFARDRLVYLYLTTSSDNRVVRATLEGDRLGELQPVLTGIPRGLTHDGGRLLFGPDGLLYVSTGETGVAPELAQQRDSLGGKILRITPDGDPAPGNPFGTPVWSWGHRNVQGLAFDDTGALWASEFGDSTYDELNRIERGANYGWPEVEGKGGTAAGFVDPQLVWRTDDASPSGLAYLDGHLWMAALKGERLWRVRVAGERAVDPEGFFIGEHGRVRTVAAAPDGMLWVMTSNRDGRGDPGPGDDKILLVRP